MRYQSFNWSVTSVVIFMLSIVMVLYATPVHAQTTSTPRLEQLIKNSRVATTLPGSLPPIVQPISCHDLSGEIQTVTVSLESTGSSGGDSKVTAFFTGWNGYPTYAISDTQVVSVKQDHTFTFGSPVDVSVICPDPNGYAYLALTNTDSRAYVYGSSSLGWYFIINGVAQVNHPPVLQPISDQTTSEGKHLSFSAPSAIDNIDGGPMTVTVSGLPDGATFDGALHWTPRFDQAGSYQVIFTVTDDGNQGQFAPEFVSQAITITVLDAVPELHRLEQLVKDTQLETLLPGSYPPKVQAIACQELSGQIVDVTVSLDSSGNTVTAFFTGWNGYPTYATSNSINFNSLQHDYTFSFATPVDTAQLCPNPNGYAYLALTSAGPGAHVWGSSTLGWYYVVNPSASTNRPPAVNSINGRIIDEGQPLEFTVTATDPDVDDVVTLSVNNLPAGATFNPQTGEFSWTPGYDDAGIYSSIEFVATDNGNPVASTSEAISITVNNVNRAPVLESIGNKSVDEGQSLSFTVIATDPDLSDEVTLSANNLPAGATFEAQTGIFSWTPAFTQAGIYLNVIFTVTDNGNPILSDSETITITVNDVPPLELTTIADSFLRQGQANRNEGANPHLFVQSTGHNRALSAFDGSAIANYVATHGISSAKLILTIASNGNNWGSMGRTIDAHPLLGTFTEGNGKDAGLPGAQSTRGTGSGTTWNCADDTAIQDTNVDCGSQWDGGTFGIPTASSATIVNTQTGEMEWDVTQDVLNGALGWLVKKTNEAQNGAVEYYSKEGATDAGNMVFAPRLVLTP